MPIQNLSLVIEGASPLIMHNGELANRNYWAAKDLKRLTSNKKKTDADHDEMAKVEWFGSLYLNSEKKIVIPEFMQSACMIAGAKKAKLGNQAKAGLMVEGDAILNFDGKDLPVEELWTDPSHQLYKTVKIGTSKVLRMRPIFQKWSFVMKVSFLDELLDQKDVIKMATDAGVQCGLGDWRPQHGRFRVAVNVR